MNRLSEILNYNAQYVSSKKYVDLQTSKFPDKKMIIFSCMDTRLTQLLPEAMNLQNGDAKIIKNAGAIISHPFGSIMRSIIVAIYELKADEIFVVGHHGCGMAQINVPSILKSMKEQGIPATTFETLKYSGIDLVDWLKGFDCVESSIRESVEKIRMHPLIPKSVAVHGLIMNSETGSLDVIVNGYESHA